MYSVEAMKIILRGFKNIVTNGKDSLHNYLHDFLIASTYAGIAFGNAGCGMPRGNCAGDCIRRRRNA